MENNKGNRIDLDNIKAKPQRLNAFYKVNPDSNSPSVMRPLNLLIFVGIVIVIYFAYNNIIAPGKSVKIKKPEYIKVPNVIVAEGILVGSNIPRYTCAIQLDIQTASKLQNQALPDVLVSGGGIPQGKKAKGTLISLNMQNNMIAGIVDFEAQGLFLVPNSKYTCEILFFQVTNAISVTPDVLVSNPNGGVSAFVFNKSTKTVEERVVYVKSITENYVEIEKGLTEADYVVVKPPKGLASGDKVNPVNALSKK